MISCSIDSYVTQKQFGKLKQLAEITLIVCDIELTTFSIVIVAVTFTVIMSVVIVSVMFVVSRHGRIRVTSTANESADRDKCRKQQCDVSKTPHS